MTESIQITFPDGATRDFAAGTTGLQLAESISKKLAKNAVAIRVNGEVQSLQLPLTSGKVEIITRDQPDGLEVIRHSAAHVLADAVKRLRPNAKLWKGPAITDPRYGFYYDIDVGEPPLTHDDLPKLEQLMGEIVAQDHAFVRKSLPRAQARALMAEHGEDYKVATIDKIPADDAITFYQSGQFVDLCRGPHVPSTGRIGAGFAVLALAGAYFGDDAGNKMLTRIYGHAFADKAAMDQHRKNLEEAAKRDHRRLGKDLDLYSTLGELGAGLVLWHPKGGFVRHKVEEFWRNEHLAGGYDIVYSPHVARSTLWQTSGHLDFYKESMYSPIDIDGMEYLLKPMNCPFHVQIFKSKRRSYRELPFRWAELGTVYRYENAGALHGLLRVRGFTQDDAHIFMRPDQLEEEIERVVRFVLHILQSFGFTEYAVQLATRPPKYVGTDAMWEAATNALRNTLHKIGLAYDVDEGGGAFYGPKIDVKIKDSLGRYWQCSTVQADFNLPERFDLQFVDQDGSFTRPVMVHRALLGSLERFFGVLIEHYGGAFPTWLAPVQMAVLAVGERHAARAEEVAQALRAQGYRAVADVGPEKIGNKIRQHLYEEKVPYIGVVGDKEVANGGVSVRHRQDGELGELSLAQLSETLAGKVAARR
jgi:threonyl-tRNA synthetase